MTSCVQENFIYQFFLKLNVIVIETSFLKEPCVFCLNIQIIPI